MEPPVPILILDNTSTFGGATKSLSYLLRALDRERFKPILVTGQSKEFLTEHFDCTWYHYTPKLPWVHNLIYRKIVSFKLFRFRVLKKTLHILRFMYWIIFITVPEAFTYARLGRKHSVAVVHLNNILGSQLAGILAAKLLRVPCVAHLRDFEEVHPITRFYARLIDHHVAISGAIRDNLLELGVPDTRITVVHDALDLADFQSTERDTRVKKEFGLTAGQATFGIFGRIVEWKGIREFILAAREVFEDVPDARAFVVGDHSGVDGAFFRSMQQLVADLGLNEKITFTGYRDDVPDVMAEMAIIVHASTRPEPFGMVIIEGMAMKKPVIASNGGGPLDIIVNGETGLLVESGDATAMGHAISTLLRHHDLRRNMGLAGFERVSRLFTSHRYASQMAVIYQHLGATA